MVICLFGESCTGKSTLAAALAKELDGAQVYSGKDYLRLSHTEAEAEKKFRALLANTTVNIIYVASEKAQLALLPTGCFRVLVTADLELIKQRFAARMNGHLPKPVEKMLEAKHGMFDNEPNDLHLDGGAQGNAEWLLATIKTKSLER